MPKRSLYNLKSGGKSTNKSGRTEVELKWKDEEIDSDDEERSQSDDMESNDSNSEEEITAEQKRKRLAQEYLASIQEDDSSDSESSSNDDGDDGLAARLRRNRLMQQGKYVRRVAESFRDLDINTISRSVFTGHKLAVTCLALSSDDTTVFSGSKDNSLLKWDIESGAKTTLLPQWRRSTHGSQQSHSGEILSVAVSTDGKYVASGGRDNFVRVFDNRTNTEVKAMAGHRDAVTSLSFKRDSYSLFSGSLDRCIKHWDLNEMGYLETLFGHQDGINAMDWSRDRPITSSIDRTVRLWKVSDETHLVFRGHKASIDNVQFLTPESYMSSGQDGALCMWKETQKKPIATIPAAHGVEASGARWVSAMASMKASDLVATGSNDGFLRFWHADADDRELSEMTKWEVGKGFVNSIAISPRLVVIGTGNEHRMGRWWRERGAKNRVEVFNLGDLVTDAEFKDREVRDSSDEESESGESAEDDEESDSDN